SVRTGSDPITLDISGRDLGALIGWRGETLRALQAVTNVMVGKHLAEGERIIVDVERYRQRREHTVREIAMRAARQVKMTGDAVRIRRAIALINAVADEAGDEEITPTEIAEAIRDCLELPEVDEVPNVRRYLGEALDAVSDGMPADFVAMTLYAALGALREGGIN